MLPDVNLLLYAENENAPQHKAAREWWDGELSNNPAVCVCWTVLSGFIRISTNPRAFVMPLTIEEASERISSWLARDNVRLVQPTSQHWQTLSGLLVRAQAFGNLVTDAHIAAVAIDHGCELCSTDADFSRFPGLKWRNPLA